jgi:hypothetical protein
MTSPCDEKTYIVLPAGYKPKQKQYQDGGDIVYTW